MEASARPSLALDISASSQPGHSGEKQLTSQHAESGFIEPLAKLLQGGATPDSRVESAGSTPGQPGKAELSGGNSLRSDGERAPRPTDLFERYPRTFFKADSPEYVIEEAPKPAGELRRLGPGRVVAERAGAPVLIGVRELPARACSQKVSRGSARVVSEVELKRERRSGPPPRAASLPPVLEIVTRDRVVELRRERAVPVERVVDVHYDVVVDVPVERTFETEIVTEVTVAREVEKVVEIPVEEVYEVGVERVIDRPVEVLRHVEVPVERVVERPVEVVREETRVHRVFLDVDERDVHLYPGAELEPTTVERRWEQVRIERPVFEEHLLEREVPLPLPRGGPAAAERVVELPLRVERVRERAEFVDRAREVPAETVREVVRTTETVVEHPLHYEVEVERRVEVLVERVVEVPVEHVVEVPVEIRIIRPVFVERRVETEFPVEIHSGVCIEESEERSEEVFDEEFEALIEQRRNDVHQLTAANAQRREGLRAVIAELEELRPEDPADQENLWLIGRLMRLHAAEAAPHLSARTQHANALTEQLRAAVATNADLVACLRAKHGAGVSTSA